MTLFERRDWIVKEAIKPILKNNGFKVAGNTFRKVEEDFKRFLMFSPACLIWMTMSLST